MIMKYLILILSLFYFYAGAEEFKKTEAPDFGAEFTKPLKNPQMADAAKYALLRSYADTHIAEGDYVSALDILGDKPDGTAEWFEVYGGASLGNRNSKKALWAFQEAQKQYEADGDSDKAHQMSAMINILSPKK